MKSLFLRVRNYLSEAPKIKRSHIMVCIMLFATLFVGVACAGDATTVSNNFAQAALDMWGMPGLTHFYEWHQAQQIYEERDNPDLLLNVYLYSPMTGQLTCFGKSYGYGVPYSTEMSPPTGAGSQGSVPEPNGLYPSQNTNADWVNRDQDKNKGDKVTPEFVEPELIITPKNYPCTPLTGTGHD